MDREHNMVVRVSHEEIARAHRLATDAGEPIAIMFRRWLNDAYRSRWGAEPAPEPTLKHAPKDKPKKGPGK